MSWHTGGAAIEGIGTDDPASVVAALGLTGKFTGRTVTGDEAGSSSLAGRAVGQVGGWSFVWDPTMLMGDDPSGAFGDGMFPSSVETSLVSLSLGRRVVAFLTEGASSTHGYSVYNDGSRVRLWLIQEGALVMEAGAPLPAEASLLSEEDGEARVLGLIEAITGVTFDQLFEAQFSVVE